MASYNDLSFSGGEYIPQYAGIPLDEIRRTADTLSTRHYQNLASASQLQILQQQLRAKALPGARPYFDQHIAGVQAALEDMARNGGENSTARINALATSFQGDQGMLQAMQQADEVRKIEDMIQKVTTETGADAVYHKDRLNAMRNAPVYVTDAEGNTTMNPLYSQRFNLPVSPYLNPNEDYKKIVDEIKPDKWLAQGLTGENLITFQRAQTQLANGEIDIPQFVYWATKAGITQDKIQKLKSKLFEAYKNTKSYSQQKEYFDGTDDTMKEDLFNYAQLGVYSQLDPHYMQVATGRGTGPTQIPVNNPTVQLPAAVRENFGFKFDPDKISPNGVRTSLWGDIKEFATNEAGDMIGTLSGKRTRGEDEAHNKRQQELLQGKGIDNEATKELIDIGRNVMTIGGGNPNDKIDKEILAWASTPGGKQQIVDYMNTWGSKRFHQPRVVINADATERKAQVNWAHDTFDTRTIMDEAGNVWNGLRDEDGDVQDDLLPLSKALQDGKASYNGTLDPRHIWALKGGDNMARAIKVTVPVDDKGNTKVFFLGQAGGQTEQVDINESVIYNKAMVLPGSWTDIGQGYSVQKLVSDAQKDDAWLRYGVGQAVEDSRFTRESVGGENTVLIKAPDGTVRIALSEAGAAQWFLQNGINLTHKK